MKSPKSPAAAARRMRPALLLLAGLVLLATVAPPAAACTVQPPQVCTVDTAVVELCAWGPCPPATMGGIYVRVLDQSVLLPFPV